jgi:alpha-glucosidase
LCAAVGSAVAAINAAPARALPQESSVAVHSPDGRIVVDVRLDPRGAPHYQVTLSGQRVLDASRLGLVRDDGDFSRGLRLQSASEIESVEDVYELLTAKRRHNHYRAHRRVWHFVTADGKPLDIVFQVSNDGVAYRYVFPDTTSSLRRVTDELTSFRMPAGARAWLQPMQVAKTGWGSSNPAYEEYYQHDIPVGTPSLAGAGWVFPALFRVGEHWLLVSETGLDRNYAGGRLRHESPDGEYTIGFPDSLETRGSGFVKPASTLPWATPWRFVIIGSLQTIVESMLGLDLALPARAAPAGEIMPGKAAWSWPLLGDAHTVFETQKQFIDYAADMGWRYTLIDALWDTQIGDPRVKELIDYAHARHVRILLWYNSAGSWNTTPQTPRDRMLTHAGRVAEFERLKQLGVAGLKIDFFGGDAQDMIEYYHDIMQDAAPYGFLLNFHGATLPRGWSRTYPHLMTMEAVKGLEFATFTQENADQVPAHAALLPFTRNVFDPMDFTPLALDRLPRTRRRTTAAAELAQAILFTSGIQHYAETPAGMAKAPAYVRDFLRGVPVVWDDVRFLAGYPGQYVVLARRSGQRWWIAGLNGEAGTRDIELDLREFARVARMTLITDGDDPLGFGRRTIRPAVSNKLHLTLPPYGGFVMAPAH